ncbi:MAG: indolepyruvate oxidoreductase subunit beta family protein [Hyphomicrobiaceae bacterium]
MEEAPKATNRPLSLLICAMGGEGGGVLTNWIVAAAREQGLAVQATSVPGVAQRTGGTTYYVEMAQRDDVGRAPVFALVPVPSQIDVVISSELTEAARAARLGFVTPERTALISSTHRVFLIEEKMAMGDGRLDDSALAQAAQSRARRSTLLDLDRISREAGAPISAAMLGALAGTAALPISRASCEAAIRASAIAVERNLAAFAAAFEIAASCEPAADNGRSNAQPAAAEAPASSLGGSHEFPAAARGVIALGEQRLAAYQDQRYADLYRQRLAPFANGDPVLCRDVARNLALRMSYEDVIRVAQLKADAGRFARIRGELGAAGDEPFEVRDFFKPGVNEIADILPPAMARRLLARAGRGKWPAGRHVGMQVRTTTVSGYLQVWLLARLRGWRRRTWRYQTENREIESWLALIRRAAAHGDAQLAREIAELARLIKGYGDTHQRGSTNYRRIVETLVAPALDPDQPQSLATGAAARIRAAREAALADAEGRTLEAILSSSAARTP